MGPAFWGFGFRASKLDIDGNIHGAASLGQVSRLSHALAQARDKRPMFRADKSRVQDLSFGCGRQSNPRLLDPKP